MIGLKRVVDRKGSAMIRQKEHYEIVENKMAGFIGMIPAGGWTMEWVEETLAHKILVEPKDGSPPYWSGFEGTLYQYQKEDVLRMLQVPWCLNANKQGYGKTVESIAYLWCLWVSGNLKHALILTISPSIVVPQWNSQLDKLVPVLRQSEFSSMIHCTNYNTLLNDKKRTELRKTRWDVVICDEVTRIKNRDAKTTKWLATMTNAAQRRVGLTGTPITRYVDDLYSILHWLHPDYVATSGYWSFVEYFCKLETTIFGTNVVGSTDNPEALVVLQSLLDYMMVRQKDPSLLQQEWMLKEPIETTIKLQWKDYGSQKLATYLKQRYTDILQATIENLPLSITVANGAVVTTRLRQYTCSPRILFTEEAWLDLEEVTWGPKFYWIKDFIDTYPTKKIVVYTGFTDTCNLLQEFLGQETVAIVNGKMLSSQRQSEIKRWTENPECTVLVATIGSIAIGTDGLQQVSDTCIFVDRDWSPSNNAQAISRLWRDGQEERVSAFYLEIKGTFDRQVARVDGFKEKDLRRVLNENLNS